MWGTVNLGTWTRVGDFCGQQRPRHQGSRAANVLPVSIRQLCSNVFIFSFEQLMRMVRADGRSKMLSLYLKENKRLCFEGGSLAALCSLKRKDRYSEVVFLN